MPVSTISIAATSAREIAADLERIGSPVTRDDFARYRATLREPLHVELPAGDDLQHRRADARRRLVDDPGVVRPARRHRGRRLRPHPRPGRSDQARAADARSRGHRSADIWRMRSTRSRAAFHCRRGNEDRPAQGGAVAARRGRRRHDLDGRRRQCGPGRLLYPIALLGVRLRLRAAADRRADAEPRHQFLAATRRAQFSGARACAVPHAQSGAGGAQGRARHGLWHHGRRRPAANPSRRVHASCACSASRSPRRSIGRAGCSAGPGAIRAPRCGWNRASTAR